MVQEGILDSDLRKHYSCQTFVKTDGVELNNLFPAQPSLFTRHNGKCNICILNEKFKLFEGCFFVISSHLVQALERTKRWKHFVVKSIAFDRFMTSEGTGTFELGLYPENGAICSTYQTQNISI